MADFLRRYIPTGPAMDALLATDPFTTWIESLRGEFDLFEEAEDDPDDPFAYRRAQVISRLWGQLPYSIADPIVSADAVWSFGGFVGLLGACRDLGYACENTCLPAGGARESTDEAMNDYVGQMQYVQCEPVTHPGENGSVLNEVQFQNHLALDRDVATDSWSHRGLWSYDVIRSSGD